MAEYSEYPKLDVNMAVIINAALIKRAGLMRVHLRQKFHGANGGKFQKKSQFVWNAVPTNLAAHKKSRLR